MTKVLLVIDMQNDFIDGALGTKEAQAIVPKVFDKVRKASSEGDRIFFTRDTHFDGYLNTMEGKYLPVPHCIKNSKGWQLREELLPFASDSNTIDKPTFGTFSWMSYLPNDELQITLVGLCTDICVVSNALILKTMYPNAEILVDTSCCAGVTPESHEAAIQTMKACQVNCY